MLIKELPLKQGILDALLAMGYEELTPVQAETLQPALSNNDMFVRSQTGSGKTMAFGMPIANRLEDNTDIEALIVCPTRELAAQVAAELKKLTQFVANGCVATILGGMDMRRQVKAIKSGSTKIVVGTPGRIIDHMERKTLKLPKVKTLVLDEADEMLNMGFKEEIERILSMMPKQQQTMLFSATYPNNIKAIADKFLDTPVKVEIGIENSSIASIKQEYCSVVSKGKKPALVKIFEERDPSLSIIFCNTKAMTTEIEKHLQLNNINALALNGDMRQSFRTRVMKSIKQGNANVLVATDVAARGIDIKDVDYVINFDIPTSDEFFLHRIGRTGRAGKDGRAITLINTKAQMQRIVELEGATQSIMERYRLGELDCEYQLKSPRASTKVKSPSQLLKQAKSQTEEMTEKKAPSRKPRQEPYKEDFQPRKERPRKQSSQEEFSSNRKPRQESRKEFHSENRSSRRGTGKESFVRGQGKFGNDTKRTPKNFEKFAKNTKKSRFSSDEYDNFDNKPLGKGIKGLEDYQTYKYDKSFSSKSREEGNFNNDRKVTKKPSERSGDRPRKSTGGYTGRSSSSFDRAERSSKNVKRTGGSTKTRDGRSAARASYSSKTSSRNSRNYK